MVPDSHTFMISTYVPYVYILAPDIPKSKTKNENMLSEIDILSTTKINFMKQKSKMMKPKNQITSELFHF